MELILLMSTIGAGVLALGAWVGLIWNVRRVDQLQDQIDLFAPWPTIEYTDEPSTLTVTGSGYAETLAPGETLEVKVNA